MSDILMAVGIGTLVAVAVVDRLVVFWSGGGTLPRPWRRARHGYGWPTPYAGPESAFVGRSVRYVPKYPQEHKDCLIEEAMVALYEVKDALAQRDREHLDAVLAHRDAMALAARQAPRNPEMEAQFANAARGSWNPMHDVVPPESHDPRLVTPEEARRARNMQAEEKAGVYYTATGHVIDSRRDWCVSHECSALECAAWVRR